MSGTRLRRSRGRIGTLDAVKWIVAHIPPSAVRLLPPSRLREQLLFWIQASLERWPRPFASRTTDGFLVTGTTRDVIQRLVHVYGVWEPETTAWARGYLERGDVAIDVGANCGYHSLLFSHCVGPSGRVVAVEAVPSIFALLEENLRRNGASNVTAHLVAAGDEDGEIELFRSDPANLGWSGTVPEPGWISEGLVPQRRVADLVDEDAAARLTLIKIDTEGDELRALRGMANLIKRPQRLAIIVELTADKLAARGHSVHEILDELEPHGFEPFRLDPMGGLIPFGETGDKQVDAVFVRP